MKTHKYTITDVNYNTNLNRITFNQYQYTKNEVFLS